MHADQLPDGEWRELKARLETQDCPRCGRPLERSRLSLQPFEDRLYVRCLSCNYAFFDDSPDVLEELEDLLSASD